MTLLLLLAGLVLLGFACQWLAWRLRLPAILFLLLAGLILGPITGVLEPDRVFGELLFPAVQLGVAIILFEGSLTLRFAQIRGLAPAVLLLVTLGASVTVLALAMTAYALSGLDWPMALLFGALTCVTGPTVIVPLLRAVRPTEQVAQLLRWEGIIIDPLGALAALLIFKAFVLGSGDTASGLLLFTCATGVVVGLGVGWLLARSLLRQWVPDYLDNFLVLAAVLAAFALSNAIAKESGLLAVTIMGITLANVRGLDVQHILEFKENLSTLLISLMFLVLAARIDLPGPATLLSGLAILLVATVLVRPFAVLVSTLGSPLSWNQRALVAYIAPRGIVAAAVTALFALELELEGHDPHAASELLQLTYIIILGTVIVQSTTASRVARWLGAVAPSPTGVMLVGSTEFARALAIALKGQGFPVLIADDEWEGVRAARMAGIPTYFGNPVSEHAAENLPLDTTRWLLALSTRSEMNSLACLRYQPQFGKHRVLRLRIFAQGESPRQAHAGALQTRVLFGEDVTTTQIEQKLQAGWRIRSTRLGPNFGWKEFCAHCTEEPLLLFCVDDRGELRFPTALQALEPKPNWRVTVLCTGALPAAPAAEPGESTVIEAPAVST